MFHRISSHNSLLLISFFIVSSAISSAVSWGVINVKYKFAAGQRSLFDLKDHDSLRQLRILAGVDLPLGGSGRPDGLGLYYAKIGIGTPPKDYYVQVDTGSDIMWVNCIQCKDCPKRSSLGIDLTLYNIKDSATGKLVSCDQEFCYAVNGGPLSGCTANMSCPYLEIYGDGSSTAGYFVKDVVLYDRVSGDLKTSTANGSVIFGCGATQSGNLDSSNEEALDGILGFGKSNTSMISLLSSSGKVKKMFAHCLDGVNGGGIFAIGHVVQPKVNMTPLVPNQVHNLEELAEGLKSKSPEMICSLMVNRSFHRPDCGGLTVEVYSIFTASIAKKESQCCSDSSITVKYQCVTHIHTWVWRPHYNVNMTAVQVGHDFLNFTTDVFESGDLKGTIIDSGTTLAYLPEMVYEPLVSKILSQQPHLKLQPVHDDYTCFQYSDSLDDAFPNVTFHFENSVILKVYPHEYLFPFNGLWCIGWQNSGMQSRDRRNMTLLGDLVLSNKLVLYDLENQVIGWTEYNCSSSIQVLDERTGTVHLVGSHYISSACHSNARFIIILILLATILHYPNC